MLMVRQPPEGLDPLATNLARSVNCVAWSADGSSIVLGTAEFSSPCNWNLAGKNLVREREGQTRQTVNLLTFADPHMLVTGDHGPGGSSSCGMPSRNLLREGVMSEPKRYLDQISTLWPLITDPARFVLRYAPAIRGYLAALLKDSDLLDEVIQDFLLHIVQNRFVPEQVTRGRFRDYLKACVRNAALTALRKRRLAQADEALLAALTAPDDPADEASREWSGEWRRTLLARSWDQLLAQQSRSPGNHSHRVLRLAVDHPDDETVALTERLAEETGCRLTLEAFRQQLSRARRRFAELLLEEV